MEIINGVIVSNIASLKGKINKLVHQGYNADDIELKLLSQDEFRAISVERKKALAEDIRELLSKHNNYKQIQEVLSSKILTFNDDKNLVLLYNETTKAKKKINLSNYKMMLDPKLLIDKYHPCTSDYRPHTNACLYEENGEQFFNTYNPPEWLRNHFYFGDPVPVVKELPACYDIFFKHLFADDKESIQYVIYWIANSLKRKNGHALTTIGKKGIGKGILGEILSLLHGKHNYGYFRGTRLGTQFNGVMHRKTLVYLDEVSIKNAEEEDNFKMIMNFEIEIEKKGVDATTITNWANIYMSSNRMDAIKPTSDERRYSVVNLTETKLEDNPAYTNDTFTKIDELKAPENIEKLANYLWHLKIPDNALVKHFESAQYKKIREASFKDWEQIFLGEIVPKYAGKEVAAKEIYNEIYSESETKLSMNSKIFEILQDKLQPFTKTQPGKWVFKLQRIRKEDGTRKFVFNFPKASELANISIDELEEET